MAADIPRYIRYRKVVKPILVRSEPFLKDYSAKSKSEVDPSRATLYIDLRYHILPKLFLHRNQDRPMPATSSAERRAPIEPHRKRDLCQNEPLSMKDNDPTGGTQQLAKFMQGAGKQ